MFHNISPEMLDRMQWLEREDDRERRDGTPRSQRLRQIPIETGRFLAILAASAPEGEIMEIGTSGGYSTLWLALAAGETGRQVTTFEIRDDKMGTARETFRLAGVADRINLCHGNALELLGNHDKIGFCFLDSEKEDYQNIYDIIAPRHVPGGILAADNVISHSETLGSFVESAGKDERVDSVVVPIGKGVLVCRRIK